MENLKDLTIHELKNENGGLSGLSLPSLGGILLFLDAAEAYRRGVEKATREKNPYLGD